MSKMRPRSNQQTLGFLFHSMGLLVLKSIKTSNVLIDFIIVRFVLGLSVYIWVTDLVLCVHMDLDLIPSNYLSTLSQVDSKM